MLPAAQKGQMLAEIKKYRTMLQTERETRQPAII